MIKKNHNNIGVRSMKELIFSAGRVEMECFHFCNKKKEHNFQTDENIALFLFKRKKTKARLCSNGARSPETTNIWPRATENIFLVARSGDWLVLVS